MTARPQAASSAEAPSAEERAEVKEAGQTTGWRLVLALLSRLLLTLAFPRLNVPDMVWVALVPLLVAVVGARPGAGFLFGFVQSAVFYGFTLSWLFGFLRGYAALSPVVAAAVLGLMVAVLSLYTGAFRLGVAFLSRRSLRLALAQHMEMARVRAVENRRWLLRDTNTGLTVDVDPYGRIVARLAPDTRAVLAAPYGYRSDLSLYTPLEELVRLPFGPGCSGATGRWRSAWSGGLPFSAGRKGLNLVRRSAHRICFSSHRSPAEALEKI